MSRRYDFYTHNTVRNIDWACVSFPGANNAAIPEATGVYRFVCTFLGEKQTMFADISAISAKFGQTIRACYVKHVSLRDGGDSELAEMYILDGLRFEHYQCDKNDAEMHKNELVEKLKPYYNLIKLVVAEEPVVNPFNH